MGVSIVIGVPKNGWFIRENPIKLDDDWGYPHIRKLPYGNVGKFRVDLKSK